MSDSMKKFRFGDDEIEVPESVSIEEVKAAWAEVHPSIENADIMTASDGVSEFVVRAGSKG